jgi:uncharacterized protein
MDKKSFQSPSSSTGQQTGLTMAESGDAEAQFNLGLRYAVTGGAGRDYARAEQWYLKAAAQNHPLAHFNLGIMYGSGQLGPCDWAKSSLWMQKAADLGDAGAQYQMGVNQHRAAAAGELVNASESRIDACKWFRLAAAQGYQAAEIAGDVVSMGMTHEDVLEAGRRVIAFHPTGRV